MKKITMLSLAAITLVVCFAFVKVSAFKAPHPKPSSELPTCYTWARDGKSCSGVATNCGCNHGVSQNIVTGLNDAIANNNVQNFFSNNDNVTAFGLYQGGVQELTTPGCWVLPYFNQDQGIMYYAVGLSQGQQTFDNADFILNITPVSN
jgi:hypothetical protein